MFCSSLLKVSLMFVLWCLCHLSLMVSCVVCVKSMFSMFVTTFPNIQSLVFALLCFVSYVFHGSILVMTMCLFCVLCQGPVYMCLFCVGCWPSSTCV
jgi:hypothetical protein